eukprot:5282343-Pyramimonas_sp.AAC.1
MWQSVGREYTSNIRCNIRNALIGGRRVRAVEQRGRPPDGGRRVVEGAEWKKITLPSRAGGRVSPMGSWGSWGTPRTRDTLMQFWSVLSTSNLLLRSQLLGWNRNLLQRLLDVGELSVLDAEICAAERHEELLRHLITHPGHRLDAGPVTSDILHHPPTHTTSRSTSSLDRLGAL